MFKSPFGSDVGFALLPRRDLAEYTLEHEEASLLLPTANQQRKQEFMLGRAAAHFALKNLGISKPPPVLRGTGREPLWPEGIVGSITHTADWAAAVVGWKKSYFSFGIDIERIRPIKRFDVIDRISLPSERVWVKQLPELQQTRTTMLFSAKESLFKAFYAVYKHSLGFRDAEFTWDEQRGCFVAALRIDISAEYHEGMTVGVGCQQQGRHVFSWVSL